MSGSGTAVDTLYLEPTERVARMPHADPGGVEVRRITIPEHADPDGPKKGYTIDCPSCGQWTILGLENRVEETPDGLRMSEPFECPSSACDLVVGILDGKIDAFNPNEEDR